MIDIQAYEARLEKLFVRFPSVQKVGFNSAYKPGLEHMEALDRALGEPSRAFKSVHVAGTNGKGSVSNMVASALAAAGYKVGLYTSPHIVDFRERMRVIDGQQDEAQARMITREDVWDFLEQWGRTCDELDLSFFEITTGMAFWWFRKQKVDYAVIEVGLGGRLDSTNILTPQASVITSIGLDHCALLGNTRGEIAAEKAGIFKGGVPAIVSTRDEETAPVFERMAMERGAALAFADAKEPAMWPLSSKILSEMDLQGPCQEQNLRTALTTLDALGAICPDNIQQVASAIIHTASRMDFHGRWEMIGRNPDTICDIGHNPPALKENFARLESYLATGLYDELFMVYGVMADKDLAGIIPLMPRRASYVFVAPDTARALPAEQAMRQVKEGFHALAPHLECALQASPSVAAGVGLALEQANKSLAEGHRPLIYIGGSTFVVSEAINLFQHN